MQKKVKQWLTQIGYTDSKSVNGLKCKDEDKDEIAKVKFLQDTTRTINQIHEQRNTNRDANLIQIEDDAT